MTAAPIVSPQHTTWVARDFRFHTGDVMPELTLGTTTLGHPDGEPVLVLHGTNGSAASMLEPAFADALFGPGQPLDAARHFIILPDALGAGRSSKPSDGLHMAFARYNYDDMVQAQHRLLTEHLGVRHLRVVMGYSMGGMHTWLWALKYPGFMDVAVPMAAAPCEMSGRNWMMRRLLMEAIRHDPDWQGGHYSRPPRMLQHLSLLFTMATNGGDRALHAQAPTRALADALVNQRLAQPFNADANDVLYQWDASRDYNPEPDLHCVGAAVLAVNSLDDERNPPELGLLERAMQRVKQGRLLQIPGGPNAAGHGTVLNASLWSAELADFLRQAPRR